MEKDVQKSVAGKNPIAAKAWKTMKEMTPEEIKALPRVLCEVMMQTSEKTGFTRYTLTARLFSKTVDIQFRLRQSDFYIIQKIWGMIGRSSFTINAPFRLVRCVGTAKEPGGEDYFYYYVEVLPCGGIVRKMYFNNLLGPDQADEIRCLGYQDDDIIFDRGHVEKVEPSDLPDLPEEAA
jgi:hypothetical protein